MQDVDVVRAQAAQLVVEQLVALFQVARLAVLPVLVADAEVAGQDDLVALSFERCAEGIFALRHPDHDVDEVDAAVDGAPDDWPDVFGRQVLHAQAQDADVQSGTAKLGVTHE